MYQGTQQVHILKGYENLDNSTEIISLRMFIYGKG
jgi:hypothetical protein